jgi:hypothetical protein
MELDAVVAIPMGGTGNTPIQCTVRMNVLP